MSVQVLEGTPADPDPGSSRESVSPAFTNPVAEQPSSPTVYFKEHPTVSRFTTVISVPLQPIGHLKVCGNFIPVTQWQGALFLPLSECLHAIDLPKYIDNHGYKSICIALQRLKAREKHCLISFPSSGAPVDKKWINKCSLHLLFKSSGLFRKKKAQIDLFLNLLHKFRPAVRHRDHTASLGSSSSEPMESEMGSPVPAECTSSECENENEHVADPLPELSSIPLVEATGTVAFNGHLTTYVMHNKKIYIEINMFPFIREHINHRSYHFMDSCLVREGLVPYDCYITTSKAFKRSHIHTKALLLLLKKSFKRHKKNCETAVMDLADLKDNIILSLICSQPGSCGAKSKTPNKLSQIIHEAFHCKENFLEATANLVSQKNGNSVKNSENISLHKDDLLNFLQLSFKCPSKQKTMISAVTQWYLLHNPISAQDLLYIGENLSGVRLMEALRKKLPGLLPSVTQDRTERRASKKSFRDVLLPKRTATGFCVDPKRLLEVILHKYHYLEGDVHIRLWGDGREIGGRHSVLIGMSVVSHELCLRGLSYHDPKDVFPLMMFYEGDSRDNLEENLGKNGFLDDFIKSLPPRFKVFLCGDHVFLQNILGDESDKLSPTTVDGWNLYSKTTKD